MENPLVSIIVPCYNTEEFIERCISSILNQTYENIEVIAIEQNSEDKTADILMDISSKDSRLRVIKSYHIRCTGTARNIGIVAARGEYVCFADSDDYVENDMVGVMCGEIVATGSDIVYSDIYFRDYYTAVPMLKRIHMSLENLSAEERMCEILTTPISVNKMYRRRFLIKEGIFFPDLTFCEDVPFVYTAIKYSSKTVYIPKAFYNYILNRPGSSSTQPKKEAVYQFIDAITVVTDDYRASEFYIENKDAVDCTLAKYCMEHYIRFFYLKRVSGFAPEKFKMFIEDNFTNIRDNKFYSQRLKPIYNQVSFYEELDREENVFKYRSNIIFSASMGGQRMLTYLKSKGIDIEYFMDNDDSKTGSYISDIEIIKPALVGKVNEFNIIIAADIKYYEDIRSQLLGLGYGEECIFP